MSLILSGTDGLSDVDGTAATPAIRGTDANTGIFFGTDIIGFSEGGVEAARINADSQFVAAAGTAALPVITTTGDTNTGIFFPAADTIAFSEGGAEGARFDSSGNFGLGVTPNVQFSGIKALQIGSTTNLYDNGSSTKLYHNAYTAASGDDTYLTTGYAQGYLMPSNGQHQWYIAASGTAGNTFSFTQAMTLDASGQLVLGDTVASTTHKIKSKSVSNNGLIFTGTQDVANDGTVSVTIANATMLMVADNTTGTGALFFCTYASATITLISDPSSRFATSITAGRICVTKSAVDSIVTITNKFGSIRGITISKVSTSD